MPIKINLLAEEQVTEELRRKDPVKRGVYIAVGLLVLMLLWVGVSWMGLSKAKTRLADVNAELASLEKDAKLAEENQKKTKDNLFKMDMLKKMSVVRPLWAPVLDTLQRATVNDVQVLRIRVEQVYQVTPAFSPARNSGLKPKPASTRQVMSMLIEAQDNSERLDSYSKLREQLAVALRDQMGTNGTVSLKTLNQARETSDGKKYLTFTLECAFTEVNR